MAIKLDGVTYFSEEEVKQKIDYALMNKQLEFDMRIMHITECITPNTNYMFHGKKNTTVKFKNGESITVKRMKGEPDSVETAFAYIIAYKTFGKGGFKKLLKNFKEVK